MTLFGSPVPQWREPFPSAAAASRLALMLDASGFWVLPSGGTPSGAFADDPGGSGFTVIDTTTTIGLKPTLLPSGFVVAY